MNKQLLNTIGIGGALIFSGCSDEKGKPNILFLFTDDQRYNTIEALGNPDVITPNMDKIVRSGLSFTHAHIMGGTSGAVSMPSRAMLLTGKSIFHLKNKGAIIPDDHIMMPEYLRKNGYKTFGTGKWHNGRDSYARCFDYGGKIMFHGMSNHLKVPVYDFDSTGFYPKKNEYFGKGFSSEMFADEAINYISNYSDDCPFFVYVSFSAPHDPRMAPLEFEKKYPGENIHVPENFLPEHPFDNGEMKIRDEKLAPWPRTPALVKEHLAAYYAMITHTDYQIGRILDALKKSGEYKNTIIVFIGDNGLAVGSHGLMGKQNVYEHSIRVPLIISGPGITKNKNSEALVYLNDIFPTLCNLIDIKIPESVEFEGLKTIIDNPGNKIREEVFYIYRNLHRGIRTTDNLKLIKYNFQNKDKIQLFDLNIDPREIKNLADNDDYKDRLSELEQLLHKNMVKFDDPMDPNLENWGKPIVIIPDLQVKHKAVGKEVIIGTMYSLKYDGGGKNGLVDGKRGPLDFNDKAWQGYHKENLYSIVDMEKTIEINEINTSFLENIGSWIFLPSFIEFAISTDGEIFEVVEQFYPGVPKEKDGAEIKNFKSGLKNTNARYIRVIANNVGICPDWHPGAGEKAWLFVDEIVIQ